MIRAALMRVLRRRATIITLIGITVLPACAVQAATGDGRRSAWATVNVCNTAASPNTIGIRASVPGVRNRSETRYVRFVVQYYSRDKKRWYRVSEGGDSGYLRAGRGRRSRQLGRSFRIEPPRGESVLLRGKVYFQWRVKGKGVVRRTRAVTRKGHRSSAGDDPSGYSAATCTIDA